MAPQVLALPRFIRITENDLLANRVCRLSNNCKALFDGVLSRKLVHELPFKANEDYLSVSAFTASVSAPEGRIISK